MDLAAKLDKLRGDQIGGAPVLEPELGMSVNIASPIRQIVANLRDTFYDLHCGPAGEFNLPECQPKHE